MEQGLHSQSDKSVAAAPYMITIQERLKGVNGSQVNPCFLQLNPQLGGFTCFRNTLY